MWKNFGNVIECKQETHYNYFHTKVTQSHGSIRAHKNGRFDEPVAAMTHIADSQRPGEDIRQVRGDRHGRNQ